jgi:uncharacterized protein
MTTKPSSFIWYELMTTDLDAAARFYTAVVGWTVQDSGTPGMDYRMWSMGGVPVGGLMAIPAEAAKMGMRPAWLGYLDVADVDASVAGVTKAGGAVHMPPTDIEGVGRIAMVADPQGAGFYVMTPKGAGPSQAHTPGKPGHGGWHELHTTDWEAALAFYSAQFGWGKSTAMDMGAMGTYLIFNTGGEGVGGMMNSPDFPRPSWVYYFNVDDIAAAKARVEAAGGAVLMGPQEVPGGMWILQGRDPQGAMFALLAPHKA